MWKTEECAEAAELPSGLVAAVIILMLVGKPLWVEGKASLADPLPSTQPTDAQLQTGYYTTIATAANVIAVGLGG